MAIRRTLRLKTREHRELEHYRDHDARPYVRERCSALLRIAAGEPPWGVARFCSSRQRKFRLRNRDGKRRRRPVSETRPLLGEPSAPVVAGIGKDTLAAPKPADPPSDRPLGTAALGVGSTADLIAHQHLQRIGETDNANQPGDHRLGRQGYRGSPHGPMIMPIAKRLFDGHATGILPHGLSLCRRRGEQYPGLRIALGQRAGRRGLAAALMLPTAGMTTGAGQLFALSPRISLMPGRRCDRRAHHHPAPDERLGWVPIPYRRDGPLTDS